MQARESPPPHPLRVVGWERRRNTCQPLRELDNQRVSYLCFFGGHHDGCCQGMSAGTSPFDHLQKVNRLCIPKLSLTTLELDNIVRGGES